jgi:hypothetical protein
MQFIYFAHIPARNIGSIIPKAAEYTRMNMRRSKQRPGSPSSKMFIDVDFDLKKF